MVRTLDFKTFFNLTEEEKLQYAFGKYKAKTPYKSTKNGIVTHSLYAAKGTALLKDIKNADFKTEETKKFLIRSAIYANRVIKNFDIDIIVMPKSSSPLVKNFIKELQKRIFIPVYYDSFKKTSNFSNIKIDRDNPKISDKIIKKLEPILRRAIKEGKLSLTKILPQNRKFLLNLFDVVDKKMLKKIEGKNVLIADDILTSGTTISNIANILTLHGAQKITGLTIFKS